MVSRIAIGLLAALGVAVGVVPAGAQAGAQPQTFSFYRCQCTTTAGGPLPSQLSFAPAAPRQWLGSVYAVTDVEAAAKARNACSSERRGNLFDCVACRCSR